MTVLQQRQSINPLAQRHVSSSSAAFEADVPPIRRAAQNPPVFESVGDSWIDSVLYRIKEAFLLSDDWDQEGAVVVSEHAVANARDLAVALLGARFRKPFVSATPLGGIGFEWSDREVQLFIDVYDDKFDVTVRYADSGEYHEGELFHLGPELLNTINSFVR